jgi:hypothetical protein
MARNMDREHGRLFSSGRDPKFLVLMDADSGRVLQSLSISSGADANVFESETRLLFVSTRAGKLHIFHEDSPDKLSEVETVETEFGAKTMNIDPTTHNLFLTTADFGSPGPPTKKHPRPQRAPTPGAFRVLMGARKIIPTAEAALCRLSPSHGYWDKHFSITSTAKFLCIVLSSPGDELPEFQAEGVFDPC